MILRKLRYFFHSFSFSSWWNKFIFKKENRKSRYSKLLKMRQTFLYQSSYKLLKDFTLPIVIAPNLFFLYRFLFHLHGNLCCPKQMRLRILRVIPICLHMLSLVVLNYLIQKIIPSVSKILSSHVITCYYRLTYWTFWFAFSDHLLFVFLYFLSFYDCDCDYYYCFQDSIPNSCTLHKLIYPSKPGTEFRLEEIRRYRHSE